MVIVGRMWTKACVVVIIQVLFVIVQHNVAYAKRILFVSNYPAYSHQITYRSLCLELHKKGHEIVSATTVPMKNSSLTNYTEIDLQYFYGYKDFPGIKTIPYASLTVASLELQLLEFERTVAWPSLHVLNREVYKNPEMKKLYAVDSNEHFDAVIVAQGPTISLNALAYRFKAPLIGISSLDIFNHMRYIFGSIILPSHISNWQTNTPVETNMPFWRRLVNFYEVWANMYSWASEHSAVEDAIAKEYLGQDLPHIDDITKNMSIYLVNKHPVFSYGRPEQRNVIFYHSFHITKTPDILPQNIKQFLDDAKEGFIYVSLGTTVKWEDLPEGRLETFIEAFSVVPYRILWKFNPDLLPKKYKNILALNWCPQQSILAHPNIKLFVYQGGFQSTEETIHYGVPVVGFPVLWDQTFQVLNMVRLGIGIRLDIRYSSKESIAAGIHEVINNKRYKDRIVQLSKLYKDSPYDSLQHVVQWIEYVMRQNGTHFLRNNLGDEPWYRRYDWDIIAFLAIVLFITSLLSTWILLKIFRFHLRILSSSLW
ncbi:PREDICTED: UDP-glucuronosyltransferase 2C1-like [Vollenhovia emeryi]|uniref:UDP-glucuronosyltransferase 2C1-like n=1 Tax=Vollenhovia emeryi TaxID=411798 RepID=UPI0005F41A07|nr:PREDICTED: UDP-glucuronosyltransferase 2C1-like [Vollenhovia emeryi]